jgi:hypothetical protein
LCLSTLFVIHVIKVPAIAVLGKVEPQIVPLVFAAKLSPFHPGFRYPQ